MSPDGFTQEFGTERETIVAMRVDIGEMRSDMRHMAETSTAYMARMEACLQDHETRLRAEEAATRQTQGRNGFFEKAITFCIGALGALAAILTLRNV